MFVQKLINLTKFTDKKSLIKLSLIIVFAMFIETLSIGLIIPAISFVVEDNFFEKYGDIFNFIKEIPFIELSINRSSNDKIDFIIIGLFFLLLVYFLKAVILSFINYYQIKFIKRLELKCSKKLFNIYINQPYTFHLGKNTSVLLRNIDECNTLANSFHSLLILISEILILTGIVILLFIFTTISAIFSSIFILVSVFFFYLVTKDHLLKWGEERHKLMYYVLKQIQQGLQGIKDIKILGRESFFVDQYGKSKKEYYSKLFKSEFIKSLPKLWLEFLILFTLVGITLILIYQNADLNKIFFSLGVLAAAAFRILPSINKIINCLQSLKNNSTSIENLQNELNRKILTYKRSDLKKFNFKNQFLEIKNLNYKYSGSEVTTLKNIDLKIKKGEAVGIIGESGAGKSTLLDIILGLLPATEGEVSIFGNNLTEAINSWQNEIGYVSQNIYLMDDTIKKNIALGVEEEKINEDKVYDVINLSQLNSFIHKEGNNIESIVGERGQRISGGEKQRIGIARALYNNPSLLVLDEATSALDLKTEKEITNIIQSLKGKTTILIVSHRPSTVEMCDSVYKLDKGNLIKI